MEARYYLQHQDKDQGIFFLKCNFFYIIEEFSGGETLLLMIDAETDAKFDA